MISVTQFNHFCSTIAPIIGVNGYVLASTEEQGKKKLKDKSGLQLVAVYPDYGFSGSQDTEKPMHGMLFFVVVREREAQSDLEELNQFQETQDCIMKLKDYISGAAEMTGDCKPFPNVIIDSILIEPEYNIFGGYLGWSLKCEV